MSAPLIRPTRGEWVLGLVAVVLLLAGVVHMTRSAGTDGYGIGLVAAGSGLASLGSFRQFSRTRRGRSRHHPPRA